MRKLIILCLLGFGLLIHAQYSDQNNRFNQPSQSHLEQNATAGDGDGDGDNPGNPGGVPIDNYIPILLTIGLACAVYFGSKQQRHKI